MQSNKNQTGFTLIELLVVIAIIGLLSSVVLVALNGARIKARDVRRRADLKQISTALEFYFDKYGTYKTLGGGWRSVFADPTSACGCGWLGYQDGGSYPLAVTQVLKNEGFMATPLVDDPNTTKRPGYMIYLCDNDKSYSISATLEKPTVDDIAHVQTVCNGTGANSIYTNYGKNFALP